MGAPGSWAPARRRRSASLPERERNAEASDAGPSRELRDDLKGCIVYMVCLAAFKEVDKLILKKYWVKPRPPWLVT